MKILIVEDDRAIVETLQYLFSSYNYASDIATDGETGLAMAEAFEYDLMVLDIGLPKLDGVGLCQQLRSQGFQNPILLLTGRGGAKQKAAALNAGADDYVVKPFETEELMARIQALLRRGNITNQPILNWGNLSLDPSSRRVMYGSDRLSLTPKEYAILELFLRHPETVLSAATILDHAWTSIDFPGEEAVRAHIKTLRQKFTAIGAPKDLIQTVHRVGYRLNPRYTASRITENQSQDRSAHQEAEVLQGNEQRYMRLIESSPVGIFWFDATGHCTYVNNRWCQITGRNSEAAMGTDWLQTLHPDDQQSTLSTWEQWLQTEKTTPYCNEGRIVRPDGSIVWFDCLILPDLDLTGAIIGYVGTITDISDRKLLEIEHQQSFTQAETARNQVITILESITDGFIALDGDWRFTYVNAQAGRILQRDPADLLGKRVWTEFADTIDTAFYREYHRAVAEQVTVEFEEFYPPLNTWFEVHAYPSGDGLVAYFQDISDRKQAAQKIQEQAALLDIASDAIFVRSLDHQILYWNRGAEQLYGWTAEEAIGQRATELLHEDPDIINRILQRAIDQGEWTGEIVKVTKTGKSVIIEGHWTLMRDTSGQPTSILAVNTDITEKKQLEAQFYQAQRLESLGTLASGIAHDLNNNLTPILTLAQLLRLQPDKLDARTAKMLQIIEASARRGANLVRQILTFARGTEGERIPLQVPTVLQEVVQVIQQTFPKSIALHTDFTARSLGIVFADPTHLHQVLMNLCINARDAMPNGGLLTLSAAPFYADEVFAQMHLDAKVGRYVVITIGDTGTGIAAEVRDRIFEPFFTTKPLGEGTGLGLSTVLGIVKSDGGFVKVASEVGRGSQFQIYLPVMEGSIADREPVDSLPHGDGELVLIVEDDAALRQTAQSLLETYGYQTLVAEDGVEALQLFTQHQADIKLVLMDIMMPHLDGVATIQVLQNINPQVPIVAVSGLAAKREAAIAAGARAFLAKPYTIEDLLRLLHTLKFED
ncbi:MAG: PAS domain S-box protein [Oculatellaceae cyanobacterium Prado106]|jgi:PAS domain S-box-containing protein|nr:PAS domain S-box protein [Oculatellaceae cyanobacterium Prado106]